MDAFVATTKDELLLAPLVKPLAIDETAIQKFEESQLFAMLKQCCHRFICHALTYER